MGKSRKDKAIDVIAELKSRFGSSHFNMDQLRQVLFDLNIGFDKRTASSHLEVLVEMMHIVAFDDKEGRKNAKMSGYNFDVISRSKYHIKNEMETKEESETK